MSQSQSPLDYIRTDVETFIRRGLSNEDIAAELRDRKPSVYTSARSIGRARRRWGFEEPQQAEKPHTAIHGDEAEIVTDPRQWKVPLNDTDALLRERGLDPSEWEIVSLIVNEWDAVGADGLTLKQLKVHLKRIKPLHMVIPARVNLNLRPPTPKVRNSDEVRVVVLAGDQQAPYHDTELHKVFLEFLHINEPDEGVLLGDTGDFPVISRHPDEPDWAATTQECVDAVGQILYDIREAHPATWWRKLAGNHDERLRRSVINALGDYYGLRPAQVEALPDHPPIHDPVHLYRLDELGFEYIRAKGSYEHAQVQLSKYVAARHGWIARKNSGASAHATLDHLGYSLFVGHTHRQSRVHQTKFDIDGTPRTLTAIETGCMCQIREGLGYAVAPDWQQGFAVASIWPDGKFSADLATYVDGALLISGQRY